MATKARQVDVGTARAVDLITRSGRELRLARTDRGLSLARVGSAVGLSVAQVSKIERGLVRRVTLYDLARLHAVVGLELAIRSYPSGEPIRDRSQLKLLKDFHATLHQSLRWAVEVPLPLANDLRAWDAVVSGRDWRYGAEAETAPRDSQALIRRVRLKERDGDVDGVLLVLRRTTQTRRFLSEAGAALRAVFPVDGKRAPSSCTPALTRVAAPSSYWPELLRAGQAALVRPASRPQGASP